MHKKENQYKNQLESRDILKNLVYNKHTHHKAPPAPLSNYESHRKLNYTESIEETHFNGDVIRKKNLNTDEKQLRKHKIFKFNS
jgi:hypothetical protein